MQATGMSPRLFYLCLVERNFDAKACGPPTRFGVARGMWQFIATTARNYGLRNCPLLDLQQFDPDDERYDFQKSTRTAAEYIRNIYDTQAQASGFLVMASYNRGENREIKLISTMLENPRERNCRRLHNMDALPRLNEEPPPLLPDIEFEGADEESGPGKPDGGTILPH